MASKWHPEKTRFECDEVDANALHTRRIKLNHLLRELSIFTNDYRNLKGRSMGAVNALLDAQTKIENALGDMDRHHTPPKEK